MTQPLVSVITPCHNAGPFVHRLLDSILAQTYGRIEMILVDDGSSDDTQRVVDPYIRRFIDGPASGSRCRLADHRSIRERLRDLYCSGRWRRVPQSP